MKKSNIIYAVADAATTVSVLAAQALVVLKERTQALYLKGAHAAVVEAEKEVRNANIRRQAAVKAKVEADDVFYEKSQALSHTSAVLQRELSRTASSIE